MEARFAELDEQNQAAVRELILRGLGEHWGSINASLNPDLDDLLATYGHGRTVVVLDDSETVIGTGTVIPHDDSVAEILRMSVASDHRRTGLGRSIVDELVAIAALWGADTVVLETASAWTEVVAFYASCGFETTGTEDGPFGEGTWFERRL